MSKSLIDFPNEYIVYDIETSGRSYKYNKIIEIGALKISNGIIVDKYQSFINPGLNISNEIMELTGITNLMLEDAPTL